MWLANIRIVMLNRVKIPILILFSFSVTLIQGILFLDNSNISIQNTFMGLSSIMMIAFFTNTYYNWNLTKIQKTTMFFIPIAYSLGFLISTFLFFNQINLLLLLHPVPISTLLFIIVLWLSLIHISEPTRPY